MRFLRVATIDDLFDDPEEKKQETIKDTIFEALFNKAEIVSRDAWVSVIDLRDYQDEDDFSAPIKEIVGEYKVQVELDHSLLFDFLNLDPSDKKELVSNLLDSIGALNPILKDSDGDDYTPNDLDYSPQIEEKIDSGENDSIILNYTITWEQ